jgi:hypothetical protein
MSTLPDDQHMARVSIGDEAWREFRALAVLRKRSVASYLGHLVLREINRAERVEERREIRQKANEEPAESDEVDETWVPPWEI